MLNYIDIIVVAIIAAFAILGMIRGLVKTCFSFIPGVVSVIVAGKIYPVFSKFLRTTPIYNSVENALLKTVESGISPEEIPSNEFINSLSIPDFLKESLLENNNPVVYDILNVTGVGEYVSGYIANIFMNIIAMAVVFIGVMILFKLIFLMLDIITKLPIIHSFNSAGGFIFGLCQGILAVWILFVIAVLFLGTDASGSFYTALQDSTIAKTVFNNNILLIMILKIFA